VWYQIQTKFRDEPRPRSGILRVREFIMKDAYTFDLDEQGLDRAYRDQYQAYCRIFDRCGLKYLVVQASSGAMGGQESAEFMVLTEAGEDRIALCSACGYAANTEKATSRVPEIMDADGLPAPEMFPTPGVRTIRDLELFPGGAPADRQIKTLAYFVDDQFTLLLLRGDHELNEAKLSDVTGAARIRPAQPEEIRAALGAYPGSIGAVGVTAYPILADVALRGRRNMVTGANRDDFHLRGVDVERDIRVTKWADLRLVRTGDGCPQCEGTLVIQKGLEIGHIFKLGTRYSESMGAYVLTPEGKAVPLVMGSYGIGVERIMAAAVELYHDEEGIIWPITIAPFQVILVPVNMADEAQRAAAERLYAELTAANIEVLYDDRDERAGVKFKDADLIGIPLRVTIGPQKLARGQVEIRRRRTRAIEDVALEEAVSRLREIIEEETREVLRR
jgi:prolyl-tRNA synthetase